MDRDDEESHGRPGVFVAPGREAPMPTAKQRGGRDRPMLSEDAVERGMHLESQSQSPMGTSYPMSNVLDQNDFYANSAPFQVTPSPMEGAAMSDLNNHFMKALSFPNLGYSPSPVETTWGPTLGPTLGSTVGPAVGPLAPTLGAHLSPGPAMVPSSQVRASSPLPNQSPAWTLASRGPPPAAVQPFPMPASWVAPQHSAGSAAPGLGNAVSPPMVVSPMSPAVSAGIRARSPPPVRPTPLSPQLGVQGRGHSINSEMQSVNASPLPPRQQSPRSPRVADRVREAQLVDRSYSPRPAPFRSAVSRGDGVPLNVEPGVPFLAQTMGEDESMIATHRIKGPAPPLPDLPPAGSGGSVVGSEAPMRRARAGSSGSFGNGSDHTRRPPSPMKPLVGSSAAGSSDPLYGNRHRGRGRDGDMPRNGSDIGLWLDSVSQSDQRHVDRHREFPSVDRRREFPSRARRPKAHTERAEMILDKAHSDHMISPNLQQLGTPKTEHARTAPRYNAMSIQDLKIEIGRRGLDCVFCFSKEDLIARLRASDNSL